MVHVGAALGARPFRVVLQQRHIEPVQPTGRADVERAFANLLDRGDARERQEETEVVREVGIVAGDGFAAGQVFGLKLLPIGREDELGLVRCRLRTFAQRCERLANPTGRACRDVDVATLKDTARKIGLIGSAFTVLPQTVDGRLLVPEGGEELEGKLDPIKRLGRELGYGFFDFDGVHKKTDSSVESTRQAPPRRGSIGSGSGENPQMLNDIRHRLCQQGP